MCKKLKAYPSEEVATHVMWKMVAHKIGAGKLPCRVFRCPNGKHWHLTSMAPEVFVTKRQERIVKQEPVRPKPGPPPINTTTPSGKPLPW